MSQRVKIKKKKSGNAKGIKVANKSKTKSSNNTANFGGKVKKKKK